MPFNTKAKRVAWGKSYYASHKDNWKHADGTWKHVPYDPIRKALKSAIYYKTHKEVMKVKKQKRSYERRFGLCAICGKLGLRGRDHNHVTHVLRGWLCLNCNIMIGHAKESLVILDSAKEYLRLWNKVSKITVLQKTIQEKLD